MKPARIPLGWIMASMALLPLGCAERKVDFSQIKPPARPAALDAYNVFVGQWNWEAEALNAEEPDRKWTGTAEWKWTLDNRCLHGTLSAKSSRTEFQAAGIWGYHPTRGKYFWSMMNNWGYPQEGSARYDEGTRTWTMSYDSVGLDGTTSYGRYSIKVVNNDMLEWNMTEWADMTHMFKKIEMKGAYTRKKSLAQAAP